MNRATGIELSDGRQILASRAVIAGTSPKGLRRLTGDTAPAFDRAMDNYRHAPGTIHHPDSSTTEAMGIVPEGTVASVRGVARVRRAGTSSMKRAMAPSMSDFVSVVGTSRIFADRPRGAVIPGGSQFW